MSELLDKIYDIIRKEVAETSIDFGYDRNESHNQDKYVSYKSSLESGNLDHLTDDCREMLIDDITNNIFNKLVMLGII